MMLSPGTPNTGWFLLQTSRGWRIAAADPDNPTFHDLECTCDAAPDVLGNTVAAFLEDCGSSAKNIVLGVSSTSAMVGSLEVSLDDQRSLRTLEYELESVLPFAAEEVVADFACNGEHVFGVCVKIEDWLPVVIELEMRGLRVQSISPVALLAMQAYLTQATAQDAELVLWREDPSLDLFHCCGRAVTNWCHWSDDPRAAARQLAVESLSGRQPVRCHIVNAADSVTDLGSGIEFHRVETKSLAEHALQAAASVLEGNSSPSIELRREELAAGDPNRALRGSLRFLYVAAAICLTVLASVFWFKSVQYRWRSEELQRQQAAAFREAFPQARVPAGVLSRLRSEHGKLRSARSWQGDTELPVSALHVLFEFLAALPDQQRYRFREFRIEDGKIDVDVELRSHNGANVLVSSFENRGFAVSAPTTVQQNPQTVSSRIFADLRADSGQGGE